jgi:hypothetical protein
MMGIDNLSAVVPAKTLIFPVTLRCERSEPRRATPRVAPQVVRGSAGAVHPSRPRKRAGTSG